MWIAIIVIAIVVILLIWAISAYNGLVALHNRTSNGWAQIDVVLRQRADLVPNLVETVKGYATHEQSVFDEVTAARAGVLQAMAAQDASVDERVAAENRLSNALISLRATAEAYPNLKANENFMSLQNRLASLEEKIAYARQFYNDVVYKYDTKLQSFPDNLIAGMFHFEPADYFRTEEDARAVPQVSFR
ncbi:LemA family protein [Bifidobacterium choloepi]|uniref:LemA family protein n=1 Tax=Bifidobacterium choloepi TaxID=2614131 RepID=A0A6I5MZQ4_9BIFI|nr:LemA family protein [Bifidobacterium choloepi]NEG69706.1 LemA family protein [Bifidobacterium choloepi]